MDRNCPILFLPGVMGSRLHFPKNGYYWDPDHTQRMRDWFPIPGGVIPYHSAEYLRGIMASRRVNGIETNDAVVINDLTAYDVPPYGQARGWAEVAWSYYGDFLRFLEANSSSEVWAIGYDWRQSNWDSADAVRWRIDAILKHLGAEEFALITHSMGGLVARAMLRKAELRQNDRLTDRIRAVIHICQPVRGAVVAYRRFFTGMHPDFDGNRTWTDWAFRQIVGNNPHDFAAAMSGLPGPMELLPTKDYASWHPGLAGGNDVYSLYMHADRPPRLVPQPFDYQAGQTLNALVAKARDFHAKLREVRNGGEVDFQHPRTWSIYGTGRATDVEIAINPRNPAGIDAVRRYEGDGTVPAASASALPAQAVAPPSAQKATSGSFPFKNLEHATACVQKDGLGRLAVARAVANILRTA